MITVGELKVRLSEFNDDDIVEVYYDEGDAVLEFDSIEKLEPNNPSLVTIVAKNPEL